MAQVEYFSHSPLFDGLMSDVVSIPLGNGLKMLKLGGVAAEDPEGVSMQSNVPLAGDFTAQARAVWARIGELLELHGAKVTDIVHFTVYFTDARHIFSEFVPVMKEVFGDNQMPGSTAVVVGGLAHPELLVEVDVTAVARS